MRQQKQKKISTIERHQARLVLGHCRRALFNIERDTELTSDPETWMRCHPHADMPVHDVQRHRIIAQLIAIQALLEWVDQ